MQFFVVLEKFTCAYLFQIALEIIRLPIQIAIFGLTTKKMNAVLKKNLP